MVKTDYPLFFGCFLIAFSPSIVLFFLVVARRAQLIIISVTSAFTWLLSVLVASVLWKIIPPLQDNIYVLIVEGVITQELFRYLLFFTYAKAEKKIKEVTTNPSQLPLNDATSGIAAGVGFGVMQSTVMYGSLFANSLSVYGVHYPDSCTHLPLLLVSAMNSLAFVVLQLGLTVLAFTHYRRKNWSMIAFIYLAHLGASYGTAFNKQDNGCAISLPIVYGITALASFVAVWSFRGDIKRR